MIYRILLLLVLILAACSTPETAPPPEPTDIATNTPPAPTRTPFVFPTDPPSATPEPVTPTMTAIPVDPLVGLVEAPPIDIDLPADWLYGYDTLIFSDIGDLNTVPFALYTGPVTGGEATIVLIWRFRSVTPGNPLSPEFGVQDMWVDGLRLLRTLVIEGSCNIGTDPQRYDFTVGGLPATGTYFQAVDCGQPPEALRGTVTPDPNALPDTRGWFAALSVDGLPFAFYVYTNPLQALETSAGELQVILDSVRFRVDDARINPSPEGGDENSP